MGNIWTGYQVYGTSNSDLHLGLGYINYDRDRDDVNVSDLIIVNNKINGVNADGSYNIKEGGTTHTFSITICCRTDSPWTNVEFNFTHSMDEGVGTYTSILLDAGNHISVGVSTGYFTENGVRYNYATIPTSVRAFSSWNRSDSYTEFGNQMGSDVPYYNGNDPRWVNLSTRDKLSYIVKNDIDPSNQGMLEGDLGITTWDVYCYNNQYPSYRFVWRNERLESDPVAYNIEDCKIKLTVNDTTANSPAGGDIGNEIQILGEYAYTEAYAIVNFGDIQQKNVYIKAQLLNANGESMRDYYVGFIPYPKTYHSLEVQIGDVIIFHDDETGSDDKGYIDRNDNLTDIDDIDFGMSSSILYKSYSTFDEQLDALGSEVWDANFSDSIFKINTNPLDNLVSVYRTPFAISGGNDQKIQIGNYESNIIAKPVSDSQKRRYGPISLKKYYDSFLDLEPFTKILLYLPLMGLTEIMPSDILEGEAYIEYSFDVRAGDCTISLKKNNNGIRSWSCAIGDSLQLSSSNHTQVARNLASSVIANSVSAISMPSTASALGMNNIVQSFNNAYETTRRGGNFSVASEIRSGLTIYMIYIRPVYQEPSGYAHTYGKPCNLSKTISTLTGYTKVAGNVDLSGIPCTESQRQMIFERLTSGFYA